MNSIKSLSIALRKFPGTLMRVWSEYPEYEFHILRAIRDAYQFGKIFFSISGNVIFANFNDVRVFANKLNRQRDAKKAVRPGHLNAMGLIDEIYHHIVRLYEENINPNVFARAQKHLVSELGEESVQRLCRMFAELFPGSALYRNEIGLEEFLAGATKGKPNTEIILEEIILLYFSNSNPAFAPFKELFDDVQLREQTAYARAIECLETFFRKEKKFGPENQYLFDLLRAPILASPYSLEGQLAFIRQQWGLILSEKFLQQLLSADDLIAEDLRSVTVGVPVQTVVPKYRLEDIAANPDYERFSADLEWMPKVVILAKNTYVWLDQLSKKYQRSIATLNEIPDEELDRLQQWNVTGLWLIGIWERSRASQRIKQMTGNPEAVASAYSLYDYEIAHDLGGEAAFQNLRRRAWQRGIRLAGDMVPNHVGIFSKWVVEHPDYFVQSSYSPFPNYHFTGANLSDDERVEIRIEDGYWNRTDAAVVFQRVDRWTGDTSYIYHGNDGTSMPWNDTAQLNFLRAEVREAVIQAIFHVARKFSIIRFDAAMVLAKKHFQRLWYPQPGTGGAIPSRADHALSLEEFEKLFPLEFWREVVDRINTEMPGTLLLAEAFWLLEGYFVRTLGMHRVYNSAFMHMLMKEENPKYRELIRSTLHYNPEILKRYVNFMSNPDEKTAVEQFGNGDKYFGVAVLMVTLPGLPMFAHGQIEGFSEKYGMEYRRAYYNENVDDALMRRHENEIFPLMAKRHLFSQVADFELYDFVDTNWQVNENVFAYSNMSNGERALVCFHNKYEETSGWIKMSVGKTLSPTDEPNPNILRKTVAEALQLKREDNVYYIFRDAMANREFIRSGRELNDRGIYFELKAFQYHVFLDFREVFDTSGDYWKLAQSLEGRGISNIDEALQELRLAPIYDAMKSIVAGDIVDTFMEGFGGKQKSGEAEQRFLPLQERYRNLLMQIQNVVHISLPEAKLIDGLHNDLEKIQRLNEVTSKVPIDLASNNNRGILLARTILHRLFDSKDNLNFDRILEKIWNDRDGSRRDARLVQLLLSHSKAFEKWKEGERALRIVSLLDQEDVREFILVNTHNGTVYYSKELFEMFIQWMFMISMIDQWGEREATQLKKENDITMLIGGMKKILQKSDEAKYRLEELKILLAQRNQSRVKVAQE